MYIILLIWYKYSHPSITRHFCCNYSHQILKRIFNTIRSFLHYYFCCTYSHQSLKNIWQLLGLFPIFFINHHYYFCCRYSSKLIIMILSISDKIFKHLQLINIYVGVWFIFWCGCLMLSSKKHLTRICARLFKPCIWEFMVMTYPLFA